MHMDTLELHDQITTKMENTLLGSRSLNETAEAISSHDLFLQLQHQFTRDSNCLSDCSDGYKTPLSLLLLDLRPEEDYEDTRIKQAIHLIFPPMWIKRLKKKIVNNFANFQFWGHNDEDKTKFEHWRSSQDQKCIVVFDMSMKKDSDAFVFVDALYQGMALELSKDQEPVRVCYVAGGFESLLQFKAFHIYFEKPGQSPLSPQQPLGSVQPKKRFSKMNLRVTQSNDVPPSALPDSKPFFGQKIVTKLAPQEDDDEDVQSANDNAAPAHPYSVITKNIYVGSSDIPNGPNPVEELSKLGVTHVLNLAAEVPLDEKVVESGRFQARWIPVYDNTEQDLEKPLEDAIEFIGILANGRSCD
ncbi:hypothetical protein EDD86DRAFT_220376 [Gorgonomyces haynaldii]|nr:hypothetical protein EDD86DRAFT_220376 [Gorgonomyces haynaldii]